MDIVTYFEKNARESRTPEDLVKHMIKASSIVNRAFAEIAVYGIWDLRKHLGADTVPAVIRDLSPLLCIISGIEIREDEHPEKDVLLVYRDAAEAASDEMDIDDLTQFMNYLMERGVFH